MAAAEPHQHGGDPASVFERLGIAEREVVDFSVSVSPFLPPQIFLKNWHSLHREIRRYPSLHGNGAADYYCRRFGLEKSCVLPGNGSTECIYLVPRALGFERVVVVAPSYHDYERACRMAKAKTVVFPLESENGFREPEQAALGQALRSADALMLGNPNNPTNTLFRRDTLLNLAEEFPDKYILVDEAFIQFLDDAEERTLLRSELLRNNLLVFHSLTKFYAIPGIRLGAVVGHPRTIGRLREHKEPWSVGGIAERAAQLLADCDAYEKKLKSFIRSQRNQFERNLVKLRDIRLFPSGSNFVLAQWTGSGDLDDLLGFLLKRGFYIRDCRNFKGLQDNFFRFAVLGKEENMELIKQLKIYCRG